MSQVTEKNVREIFKHILGALEENGRDVSDWALHGGNSTYGYHWRIAGTGAPTLALGTTKREAWHSLRCLLAGIELHQL